MRGVLLWHEGDLDDAVELLEPRRRDRPSRSAARRSRSRSLHWLAAALRDRGDHADADQALARALDLCERAGLVAQSVEATAARAVNLALWGKARGRPRGRRGGRRPRRAAALPGRHGRQPRGRGARRRRRAERARLLGEARDAWSALGRPVDAERCDGCSRGGERVMSAWRQQALIEAPVAVGLGARRRSDDATRSGPAEVRRRHRARRRSPSTPPSSRPQKTPLGNGHDDVRDREARRPARDQAALPRRAAITRTGSLTPAQDSTFAEVEIGVEPTAPAVPPLLRPARQALPAPGRRPVARRHPAGHQPLAAITVARRASRPRRGRRQQTTGSARATERRSDGARRGLPSRTRAGTPRTGACGPARRGGSRSPCPGSPGRSRRSPR